MALPELYQGDSPLVLNSVKLFHDQGFALHLLHSKEKRPIGKGWAAKPRASWAELQADWQTDLNLGLRLGEWSKINDFYLYAIDMDIRIPERAAEAHAAITAALPVWRTFPSVISGSGGEARHIYFLSDAKFDSKVFAHSDDRFTDVKGKSHWAWELELFGTGKQVAFPGSIHPDTGLPYVWERDFDFDDLDMGLGPYVSPDVVRAWARESVAVGDLNEENELLREITEGPIPDFSIEDAKRTLAVFPAGWWDERDTWRDAGMAIHHQFDGSSEAFDLWCELSKGSTKFDQRVQRSQWKSFKPKPGGITMRSMLKAASGEQFKQSIGGDEVEPVDEMDDMIGDVPVEVAPLAVAPPLYLVASQPYDEDWRDHIKKVNKAKVTKDDPDPEPIWVLTPGLPNTLLIVKNDIRLRDTIAFNSFAQSNVLVRNARRKKPKGAKPCFQLEGKPWKLENNRNGDPWSDSREHQIRAMIEVGDGQGGYDMKVADRDLHSAIDIVAREREFHPVQEYVKSQTWDGVPRARTLFIDFLGCDDTPYHREVSLLTLLGAVARIFQPGHKFDFVPIIEGAQGKGKSTFISILAGGWYSELANDFSDDKRMVESMQGSWIIEIGELSGFSRHDVDLIKAFISRVEDKVRMAYARNVGHFKRQCIFIGSTNNKRYLRDETGARRMWPVECKLEGQIDNHKLKSIIGQVWAEVYQIYLDMRKVQPDGDLPLFLRDEGTRLEAEELQETRRVETADDAMLGQVQAWLDAPIKGDGMDEAGDEGTPRQYSCQREVAVECLGMQLTTYLSQPALAQQLSRVMTRVKGWKSSGGLRTFDGHGRQRSYVRLPNFET